MSILDQIVAQKKREVRELKRQLSKTSLKESIQTQLPCRGFVKSLSETVLRRQSAVIAECKKASPSRGVIREKYQPDQIAQEYENAGATCLSVLTDELFFQGSVEHLKQAKKASSLPIIRKDFIIDGHQVDHSRAIGADCILLIVAILSDTLLRELYEHALSLNMDILVEAHNSEEIIRLNQLNPPLIGINNRNLHNFSVDLNSTIQGKELTHKESIIVCESGITKREHIDLMHQHGIYAFLIGETLMKSPSPGEALKQLFTAKAI